MFIYKTTCLINDKVYIGKTKYNDPSYLGSGISLNLAIKKYGKDSFVKEIIEETTSEDVNNREKFWIAYYNSTDCSIGYNISEGGDGGFTRAGYSNEQMLEYKQKISQGLLNSKRYKEVVENKRNKKRPEHSRKLKEMYASGEIVPWNKGIPISAEARKKISERNKGRKLTTESKLKISESKYVPVQQLTLEGELISTYRSIKEAVEMTGIGRDSISGACLGRYLTGGGYKWKYCSE
jgi:group I intron endonuclease